MGSSPELVDKPILFTQKDVVSKYDCLTGF